TRCGKPRGCSGALASQFDAATGPRGAGLQSGVMTTRIAVLASGGGSNLQALLDHQATLGDRRHGTVVLVASDRAAAPALNRARAHGATAEVIANPGDGIAVCELLAAHDVDMVVLAGYLKLVPAAVVARWSDRILNVHPALLPSF